MSRIVEVLLRDSLNRWRQGSRKSQNLTFTGNLLEDPLDVFDESHSQHLISFVEDKRLKLSQIQRASAKMIHHASRRANDDLNAAAQGTVLGFVALATVNRHRTKATDS